MSFSEIPDPFKQIRSHLNIIEKLTKPVVSKKFSELETFQNTFKSQLAESILKLQDAVDRHEKKSSIAFKELADYGWYITLKIDISEPLVLLEMIENGQKKEVDRKIIKHLKENLKTIKKSLLNNFPKRSEVLESAFNAHERAEFFLSVPVFFSQAEGICHEITGEKLFGGKKDSQENYYPHTSEWVKSLERESIMTSFLEPLKHKGLLNKSDSEFNRHAVLHGEDYSYGSEINSLKALSLLNFVGTIVFDVKKDSN